jgi:hypothetical protein
MPLVPTFKTNLPILICNEPLKCVRYSLKQGEHIARANNRLIQNYNMGPRNVTKDPSLSRVT